MEIMAMNRSRAVVHRGCEQVIIEREDTGLIAEGVMWSRENRAIEKE